MDELVNIIKVVIEKQLTGIFNVGATTKLSKFDFAVRFAEVIGMSTMNLKAFGTSKANSRSRDQLICL